MTRTGKQILQDPVRQKLATTIRHQAPSHATRGILRSMPAFRIVKDVPEHLQVLLDRLEAAELQADEGSAS